MTKKTHAMHNTTRTRYAHIAQHTLRLSGLSIQRSHLSDDTDIRVYYQLMLYSAATTHFAIRLYLCLRHINILYLSVIIHVPGKCQFTEVALRTSTAYEVIVLP